MKVTEMNYHRNGVCGDPFFVGYITDDDGKKMLFIHFNHGDVSTAILDNNMLKEDNVRFGENSHRGDHYHDIIKKRIDDEEKFFDKKNRDLWIMECTGSSEKPKKTKYDNGQMFVQWNDENKICIYDIDNIHGEIVDTIEGSVVNHFKWGYGYLHDETV
jgi:hypothetical protein